MPTYYGGDADLLLSLNPDKEKAGGIKYRQNRRRVMECGPPAVLFVFTRLRALLPAAHAAPVIEP